MDEIDKQILVALQVDGKLSTKEVADKVGLSVTPTYERIKRLEKSGVIDKYIALLNKQKINKSLQAYCQLSLRLHSKPLLKVFEKEIKEHPEVMECYHIAGAYDYLLKIVVPDMNRYQDFLINKLAAIENIAKAESSFVMVEVKQETAYNLDDG